MAINYDRELQNAVQTFLADSIGWKIQIDALTPRNELISARGRRFYECRAGEHKLLVKVDQTKPIPVNEALIAQLAAYSPPKYRAPRLFGSAVSELGYFQVWEYVEGESTPLRKYTREQLSALIRSIASADASPHANPPVRQTHFMVPIAKRLRSERTGIFADFERQFRRFARLEQGIIEKTFSLGPPCITHNDLHSHNVIRVGGSFVLLDWESASLGPPAACLRWFCDWPDSGEHFVATSYAKFMRDFGTPTPVNDVLFAMRAHQAFHMLSTGLRQKSLARIKRGMKHLSAIIAA